MCKFKYFLYRYSVAMEVILSELIFPFSNVLEMLSFSVLTSLLNKALCLHSDFSFILLLMLHSNPLLRYLSPPLTRHPFFSLKQRPNERLLCSKAWSSTQLKCTWRSAPQIESCIFDVQGIVDLLWLWKYPHFQFLNASINLRIVEWRIVANY